MPNPWEYNCHISYTCDVEGPEMPLGCLVEISCAVPSLHSCPHRPMHLRQAHFHS